MSLQQSCRSRLYGSPLFRSHYARMLFGPNCRWKKDEDLEDEGERSISSWRWVILVILSVDICISYLPYYTFVPVLRQSMQVFHVDEPALNVLCIMYSLVFIPGGFITGPLVGKVGCRCTFVLAMGLTTLGCALRCSSYSLRMSTEAVVNPVNVVSEQTFSSSFIPWLSNPGFCWLVVGQTLCALGHPLLVSATCEVGADWFPPDERPTAAMVSNLMNFIGGSLSFILPTLIVEENPASVEIMWQQMSQMLYLQFVISAFGFVATVVLYRPVPANHLCAVVIRSPVTFAAELIQIVALKDFWIVTGQFAIYVAICHAFDAVEGSLMEHYGYNASLTSWTGLACCIGAILSTAIEARYITDASSYRAALMVAQLFIAASLVILFLGLQYHLHEAVIVLAVGVMGLATPGWGCSCELGCEVSFPAREATVTSLLEAIGNLMGILAIVVTQYGIDSGLGDAVLMVMAVGSVAASASLLGLGGTLRRKEAEDAAIADIELTELRTEKPKQPPIDAIGRRITESKRRTRIAQVIGVGTCLGAFVSSVLPRDDSFSYPVPDVLVESLQTIEAYNASSKKHGKHKKKTASIHLKNGLAEPKTFIISCESNRKKLSNIRQNVDAANLSFSFFPCSQANDQAIRAAIRNGLLDKSAEHLPDRRKKKLSRLISHWKVLRAIVDRHIPIANVIEVGDQGTPMLCQGFRSMRNDLLGRMTLRLDFVAFDLEKHSNASAIKDHRLPSCMGEVFKIWDSKHIPEGAFQNYVITRRWAKKMLQLMSGYTDQQPTFEHFVFSKIYSSPHLRGFTGFALWPGELPAAMKGHAWPHGRKR